MALRGFEGLRGDYDRLQTALYFLKIMSKLAQEGTIDSKDMFDLLGNALATAESGADINKLRLHFDIKVLGGQGVLPPVPSAEMWFNTPLKDCETLSLDREELNSLQWNVHYSLEAYLSGLT